MVFVNNKKYSCESCIKGHRSSSCLHSDRPLFEVKKKGRPVSQCDKCRELRQSRRVHSKCLCNQKDSEQSRGQSQPSSSGTKSRRFVPIAPALPNGLKDILQAKQASLTRPPDTRQTVNSLLNPCNCKSVRRCKCRETSTIVQPERSLETLARAAVLFSDDEDRQPQPAKHPTSRPVTPPETLRKRQKSTVTATSSYLDSEFSLPPIMRTPGPPTTSLLTVFPAMPPLSKISSLAGSGCTCGFTCACPGCEEHHGPERTSTSSRRCSDGCGNCVDPSLVCLPGLHPSGKSILDQFYARAASLPPPPSSRKLRGGTALDPMNVIVYPSSARGTQESGAAFGLVHVPKLECCGGNCGCPDGRCGCGKTCDGCCTEHGGEVRSQLIAPRAHETPISAEEQSSSARLRSCCAGKR